MENVLFLDTVQGRCMVRGMRCELSKPLLLPLKTEEVAGNKERRRPRKGKERLCPRAPRKELSPMLDF